MRREHPQDAHFLDDVRPEELATLTIHPEPYPKVSATRKSKPTKKKATVGMAKVSRDSSSGPAKPKKSHMQKPSPESEEITATEVIAHALGVVEGGVKPLSSAVRNDPSFMELELDTEQS